MRKFFEQINKNNKGHQILRSSKGFTLVETLVSVSIFAASILGLLIILSGSINDTGYAKKKIMAYYLAQEGIEYTRNLRDNAVLYDPSGPQAGWNTFTASPMPKQISYPVSNSDFPGFIRTISMSSVTPDEVRVSANVSWTQGSGNYNVTFTEDLFNWVE